MYNYIHISIQNKMTKSIPSGPRHAKTCLRAYGDSEGPDQTDQGLDCLLTELFDTTKCINGDQKPGLYFACAQDDLNLRILRMFEDTFSFGAPHFST